MAYEALNNAGAEGRRLIVILNDNEMSLATPVGAMSSYLSGLYAATPEPMKALAEGMEAFMPPLEASPSSTHEPYAPPYYPDSGQFCVEMSTPPLSPLEQAALAIDALYASDETAPPHWQDKAQLKKGLRGQVRRLVKDIGLDGWAKRVPQAVEHYAVQHYRKP